MKKLILAFIAVFTAVCSLSAQQENYAQMTITYATIGDTDHSEEYADKGAFLAFYKSEDGYFCMANVWPESQSYGHITDWVAYHFDATEEDYAYDAFTFNWHFANTYDDVTGVASCSLLKIYKEDGQIQYALGYTLEDDSDALFSGNIEGYIDEFINLMNESQGNDLLGIWAAQTMDVLNDAGAVMATIYPLNCNMYNIIEFKDDNKGNWYEEYEGESEEGELSYVYSHPKVYVSMSGEESEFEFVGESLVVVKEDEEGEEEGIRFRVTYAKVPPIENAEEEGSVEPEPAAVPEPVIDEEEIEEEPIPFQLVEEKPRFMGGDANSFSKWVNERLVYPKIAKENGVQGRVVLQFTVAKDGSVKNIKVLRGVDPALDNEAVRVVSMSPAWTPGRQRDRAVPVTYTFPVIFQLSVGNKDAK